MLSIEDYYMMEDSFEGVCKNCGAIRDCCEPDAVDYPCDECGENAVVGVDIALLDGLFE